MKKVVCYTKILIKIVSFEDDFRIKGKLFVIKDQCSESKDAAFLRVLVEYESYCFGILKDEWSLLVARKLHKLIN